MKSVIRIISFTLAGLLLVYGSLFSLASPSTIDRNLNLTTLIAPPTNEVVIASAIEIDAATFQDNLALYQNDDPGSVVVIYVTVQMGNAADQTNHTWRELNDFTHWSFQNSIEAASVARGAAIVQFGDENGPRPGEPGYGVFVPNATIQVRASPTSPTAQQSYKIELRNSAGLWRNQSTLVLNKHNSDLSRARQKLNFDLMKKIPDMVSMRTQFVHLYVKDETADPPESAFVDYGLYTQIEQPNRRFLENHQLDRDGQLYKAVLFDFQRYPDQIRMVQDPLYDAVTFSSVLEIKGDLNHVKLIQMLNDLNDYSVPIEQTFNKYFDADNYFTWLAYNILTGNVSTENTNFYLYSPKNGAKWYFIPWDHDASFPLRSWGKAGSFQIAEWQVGVSNYWRVVLHNRVLRVEEYRQLLDNKVKQLLSFLAPDRISEMLSAYKSVTDVYVSKLPDQYYLPGSLEEYEEIYERLPDDIQENYRLYLQSLEKPMPFNLRTPQLSTDGLTLNWEPAYDFKSDEITYHVQVSSVWTFDSVIYDETVVNLTSLKTGPLEPGEYFWRVIATNKLGKTQLPFDAYVDVDGGVHQGIRQFFVAPDGQVLE